MIEQPSKETRSCFVSRCDRASCRSGLKIQGAALRRDNDSLTRELTLKVQGPGTSSALIWASLTEHLKERHNDKLHDALFARPDA
ncbi:hypothetical protein [Bradyrhizobium sp. USDA 3364]